LQFKYKESLLKKCKPSINKTYLFLIAGLMWLSVGIMLNTYAYKWLTNYEGNPYFYSAIGFIIGVFIYYYGFTKIVAKNIMRIKRQKEKPCIFSFMSWKSYLMVAVMMKMGNLARTSSIPKQYLSIIYIIMGFALIFSSFRYFVFLVNKDKL